MRLIRRLKNQIVEKRVTRIIKPHTLVGSERIHNLFRLARRIEREKIPGDVIECGVCNGGTAALLAHFATHSELRRVIWLLDSFQGMPVTTQEDGNAADGDPARAHIGKEVGDISRVQQVLHSVEADMSRVRIIPGWFADTFPVVCTSQIALLNIDADWYESVKLCLETFYDRVVPGGFISIDDYGHWPGCRKAVDEFFQAFQISYPLREVDYTARWFQKL